MYILYRGGALGNHISAAYIAAITSPPQYSSDMPTSSVCRVWHHIREMPQVWRFWTPLLWPYSTQSHPPLELNKLHQNHIVFIWFLKKRMCKNRQHSILLVPAPRGLLRVWPYLIQDILSPVVDCVNMHGILYHWLTGLFFWLQTIFCAAFKSFKIVFEI